MLETRISDCQRRATELHGELQGLLTDAPAEQAIRVSDLLDSVSNLEIAIDRFAVCVTTTTERGAFPTDNVAFRSAKERPPTD